MNKTQNETETFGNLTYEGHFEQSGYKEPRKIKKDNKFIIILVAICGYSFISIFSH